LFKKKLFFKKKKKEEKKEPVATPLGTKGIEPRWWLKPPPNKRNTEQANNIERNLHYYIYRQAGQSLILFHFQQSFGLPNPPPFIPHFHTFPASMDQFLHFDSHNKPTTHPQKHHKPSNNELLASAKLLAEAAQSSMRHETEKLNKGRLSVLLPISWKQFFFKKKKKI
jgi:hypothetical protein